MASQAPATESPRARAARRPGALLRLLERWEPDVIDVPGGSARIRLDVRGKQAWDCLVEGDEVTLIAADEEAKPDAVLSADAATWKAIGDDVRGGMAAFRARRLRIRLNLHLGVGFLAATSGIADPERRLRFDSVATGAGRISTVSAGAGPPVICIHGLGGTKSSFLSTISALADRHRVIAVDLPGFGESEKPLTAAYNAPYFAESVTLLMDALGIERAHLVGNSMGGRVAIEAGLTHHDRVQRIALLAPAMAWLKERRWRWLLSAPVPRLGLIQPAPRFIVEPIVRNIVPGGKAGWAAAGVDEFLRAYLDPRGRAAFYAAARNIYLDEPHGEEGLWTRLAAMSPDTLFVWGRQDRLVPIAFMHHVEDALPAARHLELDCGHVPQMEAPAETHAALLDFFAEKP